MTDTKKAKKLKKEVEGLLEEMAVQAFAFLGPRPAYHVVKLGPEHGFGPPKKKSKRRKRSEQESHKKKA